MMKTLSFLLILFCFHCPPGLASSILEVDISQLVNSSESVFEGEVVSITPEMNADGNIYTYVNFLVLDALSGTFNVGETITLRFTGGTANGLTLNIGSTIPAVGEHGVYFVESNNTPLINPLYGWSQGHYRVQANGNIVAGDDQVVVGVDNNLKTDHSKIRLSNGLAKGIITLPEKQINKTPLSPPITLDQFKAQLKDIKKSD
jgi:hypothetical protein